LIAAIVRLRAVLWSQRARRPICQLRSSTTQASRNDRRDGAEALADGGQPAHCVERALAVLQARAAVVIRDDPELDGVHVAGGGAFGG